MVKVLISQETFYSIMSAAFEESQDQYIGVEPWLKNKHNAFIIYRDAKTYILFESDKRAVEFVLKYG